MATGADSDKCLQTHSWLHFGQVTKFPTKQHSSNSHGSSYSPNYQHSDQSDYIARPSRVKPMKKKKRRRAAPPHSPHKLSRRYQINKRMRALRNLIPNCTKMDKESILDEAIYYLKSLQLQLQIMPTFGGLCVPVPVPTPTSLGASSLQMFGLPLAGYGTRLQMPINPLPPQQLCHMTI